MMMIPDTKELLHLWEQGAGMPATNRALLLIAAASPENDSDTLQHWTIGQRDQLLLRLRESLFGPQIQCLTDCTHCAESIELDFYIDDVCVSHGEPGRSYDAVADGYVVQFRLPDSADLLALQDERPAHAEWQLLARCMLGARTIDGDVELATLPDTVLTAVSQGMSEVDPQAEVLLEVSCPECSTVSPATFDIVSHLWTELDAWARRMLREVHAIALAYGWSEAEILRMSSARRGVYLDLISS